MSIYELQIKPYKNITLNKVDCSAIKTTDATINNLYGIISLHATNIEVESLNYRTLTNKGYGVKIHPLYFVQEKDNTFKLSDSYYIDFIKIGNLQDLDINKISDNDSTVPYYIYTGSTKKILIEVYLLYSYPKSIEYPPRYTITFTINDIPRSDIYYGVNDTVIYDNVFINKYIININNNDKINLNITRLSTPADESYTIKGGSYVSFTEI